MRAVLSRMSSLLGLCCLAVLSSAQKPSPPASGASLGPITSVAFSPDGSKVAAGGYRVVTLLDAATGKTLAKLAGHAGAVTSLAFSPDGRTLAAAGGRSGQAGEIKLWDVKTGRPLRTLGEHVDVVYSVAFSPDGKRLAAASYDHLVSLWSLAATPQRPTPDAQRPRMLKDHTDAVYSVAFRPDGKRLASAAGDRTVKVWDAATGKRLYTLSESTAELYAVAFSPDGKQLAAGGVDKTLRVWNITATGGALARSAFAHDAAILRIAYSRDGKTIVTTGEDNAVKRWDAQTLAERKVYEKQPDWPQGLALSPNDRLFAIGRYDGSLALYESATGRKLREPLKGKPAAHRPASALPHAASKTAQTDSTPPKKEVGPPTLQPATLSSLRPTGAQRGQTVQFTLNGARIHDATGVFFDDPALSGKIVTPPDKDAGVLKVDVTLGPAARLGLHRVLLQTPRGTTGTVTFAVGDWPEIAASEPNDAPETAQTLPPECTVTGSLEKAGDTDCYRFEVQAGEELVFEVIAQPLGSKLQPVLTLLDASGKSLAESKPRIGQPDTILGYHFSAAGTYVLQLRDYANASGDDVFYRLNIGHFPLVTRAFPLGLQKGTSADIQIEGFNLRGQKSVRVQAPAEAFWGRIEDLTPRPPSLNRSQARWEGGDSLPGLSLPSNSLPSLRDGKSLQSDSPSSQRSVLGSRGLSRIVSEETDRAVGDGGLGLRLAIGEDPEALQAPGNTEAAKAQKVSAPVTVNGRLWDGQGNTAGLSHYYAFHAKKGETLLLETMARRLGSPLDPQIEVLDAQGKPIERAVLRAVGQTEITLSDHDSSGGGFRLVSWTDFHIGDYLLAGREVVRIVGLPKGPDDNVALRSYRGQRLGYLGTTPEYHSVATPVYKVEIHPPGSTFSPNGMPLTPIYYKNDDGGPLYGKDSALEFTAPANGDYLVRLSDTRGQQGADYAYRLSIHPPRPDYRVRMNPPHPNVPQGGGVPVDIECERYDGYDGPIEVRLEGLPPGFSATSSVIEAGENSATLLLSAAPDAVTPKLPYTTPIRVVAKARINGQEVVRTVEPENGVRLLTVLPNPDVQVATDQREIVIHPGEEVVVEARVARQNKFGGRVPIAVENLPFGVRVLDVGLNGVLITEQETARKFTLWCEPWVQPQTRAFYAIAGVENGVANAAPPLLLRVEPRR